MEKIYFLFFMTFFYQGLSAQDDNNDSYALAFHVREEGRTCGGSGSAGCTQSVETAFRSNQTYEALGDLWFDKYGRVMIELKKNSLNEVLRNDIYKDGFLSLPNGWRIPDFILDEKGLKGVAEEILPGKYVVIEKERTVLVVLGKLH